MTQRPGIDTLAPGTDVDAYVIKSVLGAGGFGVTYRAEHRRLGKDFAIKEYYPRAFAVRDGTHVIARTKAEGTYQWGLDRFLQEARALARFHHPAIVQVSNVFEANGTAYMVLSFEDGRDMRDWLDELGRAPTQAELDAIAAPMLDALSHLHADGLLHRDIAPDNIYIRRNGTPVLLDFGAARGALSQQSQQMSAIVKTGYSPPEQYHTKAASQGPWSDIYAFGATLYWAVSGRLPPESIGRLEHDDYVSAAKVARGAFRPEFLEGIDAALRVSREERPQTIAAWQQRLLGGAAAARAQPSGVDGDTRQIAGTRPAPIDLGPGTGTRRLDVSSRSFRLAALALAAAVVCAGAFYALRPVATVVSPPISRTGSAVSGPARIVESVSAAITGTAPVAGCDRAAAIPGDPGARSAGIETEDLDLGSIQLCTAALANAGASDRPRIQAQLARLHLAAGDMSAALQNAQASSTAGYADGTALLADILWIGQPPAQADPGESCRLSERAANGGSSNGADAWTSCLTNGSGETPRDPPRATALAKALAERGFRPAMVGYAYALREGVGVPENISEAIAWYEKAVAAGSAPAMVALGILANSGRGMVRNEQRANGLFVRAMPILQRLVNYNDANAMSWLGDLYANGWGVTKDLRETARLYKLSAERGAAYAMIDYAYMLTDGRAPQQNPAEALMWFRRAAERGHAAGMVGMGSMLEEGKGAKQDYKEAMAWFKKAAELDSPDAFNSIGYMHEHGKGVPKNAVEAANWYRRAAERGIATAMNNLAMLTENGRGVKQNLAEAVRLYERAIQRGSDHAMVNLGLMHEAGRGVPASYAQAMQLYRRAAEAGNAVGMHNVAVLYENGRGVAKDCGAALEWFRKAAAAGDADSKKRAQELGRKRSC